MKSINLEVYCILYIFAFTIYILILQVILNNRYKKYYTLKIENNTQFKEDLFFWGKGEPGKWEGDRFVFRNPIPIKDDTTNFHISEAKSHYNNFLKVFWFSCLGFIPCLIIFIYLFKFKI